LLAVEGESDSLRRYLSRWAAIEFIAPKIDCVPQALRA